MLNIYCDDVPSTSFQDCRLLGPWSNEETELLVAAVTECEEEGIKWDTVSKKVKTRTSLQCYCKWYDKYLVLSHATIFRVGCISCAGNG